MSTAPRPIHRRRGSLHGHPTLIAATALALAAILLALLVDRVFFAGGTGASTAATQSRVVPSFTGLNLVGANNVVVHVGRRQSVTVHADKKLLGRITTQVQSGSLVVGNTRGNFSSKTPMFVVVNVPRLDAVSLEGAGNITVAGISSQSLTASIPGSGNIDAAGTTTRLDVALSGSGTARLSGLTARDASASLSGDGSIMLTATHSLTATLSGTGAILYGGNPAKVTRTVTGTGDVMAG